MCPNVIMASLYTIWAYENFQKNALLSNSKENLYMTDKFITGTWLNNVKHIIGMFCGQ